MDWMSSATSAQQLLAAGRVDRRLDRRHRLLGQLDRTARVGQGDRHPGHERRPPDLDPFLFGEVTLRRHDASSLARSPRHAICGRRVDAIHASLPGAGHAATSGPTQPGHARAGADQRLLFDQDLEQAVEQGRKKEPVNRS
jgi:hypothetical protein